MAKKVAAAKIEGLKTALCDYGFDLDQVLDLIENIMPQLLDLFRKKAKTPVVATLKSKAATCDPTLCEALCECLCLAEEGVLQTLVELSHMRQTLRQHEHEEETKPEEPVNDY